MSSPTAANDARDAQSCFVHGPVPLPEYSDPEMSRFGHPILVTKGESMHTYTSKDMKENKETKEKQLKDVVVAKVGYFKYVGDLFTKVFLVVLSTAGSPFSNVHQAADGTPVEYWFAKGKLKWMKKNLPEYKKGLEDIIKKSKDETVSLSEEELKLIKEVQKQMDRVVKKKVVMDVEAQKYDKDNLNNLLSFIEEYVSLYEEKFNQLNLEGIKSGMNCKALSDAAILIDGWDEDRNAYIAGGMIMNLAKNEKMRTFFSYREFFFLELAPWENAFEWGGPSDISKISTNDVEEINTTENGVCTIVAECIKRPYAPYVEVTQNSKTFLTKLNGVCLNSFLRLLIVEMLFIHAYKFKGHWDKWVHEIVSMIEDSHFPENKSIRSDFEFVAEDIRKKYDARNQSGYTRTGTPPCPLDKEEETTSPAASCSRTLSN